MRPDMAKVLVERPRGGATRGKGYLKSIQRIPVEEFPKRERIKARWRDHSKDFSDLLGPLRRFLGSNVGRPWDLVYSEICEQTRKAFPERVHFLRHVFQYVEVDVDLIDGLPCHRGGMFHGKHLQGSRRDGFYVCPKSGLLRRIPRARRDR